jgi:hypothetical protein
MSEQKEDFLRRWSRLKREENKKETAPPAAVAEKPAPELPPADKLTPESDFAPFMHPKVQDAVRRVALKKLFRDPHFNVADPFEPFSGDWNAGEPISQELLATLNQAQTHLFGDKKDQAEKPAVEDTAAAAPEIPTTKTDEPGRQDA